MSIHHTTRLVKIQTRALRVERLVNAEDWHLAADVQLKQVKENVKLLRWIIAQRDR